MLLISLCLLAYLCGSVPFAKLVAARYGVDIQKRGSGNIGFANVWRQLGWRPALPVLIGDALKGYLPIMVGRAAGASLRQLMVVGFVAILGHCFPVWLRFRGGKGVATGLGVGLALAPWQTLGCFVVYAAIVLVWRRSAVGSMVSAWCLALACALTAPELTGYFSLLATFALWTHRANIMQLRRQWQRT